MNKQTNKQTKINKQKKINKKMNKQTINHSNEQTEK